MQSRSIENVLHVLYNALEVVNMSKKYPGSTIVCLRMSDQAIAMLDSLAKRQCLSRTDIIRTAIADYLRSHPVNRNEAVECKK